MKLKLILCLALVLCGGLLPVRIPSIARFDREGSKC
jgi:hypothetical protein